MHIWGGLSTKEFKKLFDVRTAPTRPTLALQLSWRDECHLAFVSAFLLKGFVFGNGSFVLLTVESIFWYGREFVHLVTNPEILLRCFQELAYLLCPAFSSLKKLEERLGQQGLAQRLVVRLQEPVLTGEVLGVEQWGG